VSSIASQLMLISRQFGLGLICLLIVLASKTSMAADNVTAPHVKISLVSEQNAIISGGGKDTWLGFYYQLEPGWHIYWLNPGDSGAPPRVTWKLPPGFTTGEIQWPYPARIPTSTLMDYGYENSVLLMVPLHATPEARAGAVPISADLRWLACRDLCLPGHASLQLTLPVTGRAVPDPQTHALFDAARRHLPKPLPARWKVTAESRKDDFLLRLRTGHPEQIVSFFPLQSGQIEDAAAQTIRSTPQGAALELKKSEQLLHPIPSLNGVLVLASGDAYVINAPVPAAAPAHNPAGISGLKKQHEVLNQSN
jgi:thiol:disulfide interchange protein DsbD